MPLLFCDEVATNTGYDTIGCVVKAYPIFNSEDQRPILFYF